MHAACSLMLLGALFASEGSGASSSPPAPVVLRIEAPDETGPWKMIVTNEGDVPVRLAADTRLLTFEIRAPEPPSPESPAAPATVRKRAAPSPVICQLPSSLRPSAVSDSRAVLLGPRARYEEVFSPALYCFDAKAARALMPGAAVTARLGFSAPSGQARKGAPPDPPFVAEPAARAAPMSPVKEIVSEPFVVTAGPPAGSEAPLAGAPDIAIDGGSDPDPNAPRLEMLAPARVDAQSELTIELSLTVKNVGGRPTTVHIRRDNLLFEVDGPDGAAHCGAPFTRRGVARDLFAVLKPGASQSFDVWVGEMCPDIVFDRPGLYRIRPTLAFPNTTDGLSIETWKAPIGTRDPILVRILRGRLPFYPSPPQALGGSPAPL